MKYAVCECGAKIAIDRDLTQMKRAISRHAAAHGKNKIGRKKSKAERLRIESQLARKIITSIIDMDTEIISAVEAST